MEQQQTPRKEVFKEKVTTKGRTYFFDVKESVKGSLYLTINEMRKNGDKNEYNKIMIFEDQMSDFTDGFRKVVKFLRDEKKVSI
jgi:hypothetical protein